MFISLSDRPQTKDSKTIDEKNVDPGTEKFKTNLIVALEEEDKQELRARKINWSKLDVIKDFDHTEVQQLLVNAKRLQDMTTLCLILNAIVRHNHDAIQKQLLEYSDRWREFEVYSLYLLRYLDVYLELDKLENQKISYDLFSKGINGLLPYFFQINLNRMVCDSLLSSNSPMATKPTEEHNDSTESTPQKKRTFPKFQETKVVSIPFCLMCRVCFKELGIQPY